MAHWTMLSEDPPVRLDVEAGDGGAVSGTLTVGVTTFPVSGIWAEGGSIKGRNASALSLSGSGGGAATLFVAAAGIMDGPGRARARCRSGSGPSSRRPGTGR